MAITLDGTTGITTPSQTTNGDVIIADKIVHLDDTNTAIRFPAADTFTVETAGSERLRITSNGDVGIGTTAPAGRLHARFDAGAGDGHTAKYIFQSLDQRLTIGTYYEAGVAQNARIQSSSGSGVVTSLILNPDGGNVGIGTTAPGRKLDVTGIIRSDGTSGAFALGGNSSTPAEGAAIHRPAADTLAFVTASTERMRIDSSGNFLVGTTSHYNASYRVSIALAAGTGGIVFRTPAATGAPLAFQSSVGTEVGFVSTNNSATSYITTSDYRLKENIQLMQDALAKIAQLNPVTYTWKSDGSDGQGFIAHELQAVIPDCVVGEKDAVDAEGNPQYQGIDTSFLVATLVKAIQEQQAIITQQAADITSLTARIEALETTQ